MEASENLGTRMMEEHDRVRIWEHRVPPGETGPMHLHRRPYFSVVVQGSTGDTIDPNGNVVQHFDVSPGDVVWVGDEDLPETHALQNMGADEMWIVTTEFL
jgi:mannose-6-phosphate isomerase-like protein (cupin superfamily)